MCVCLCVCVSLCVYCGCTLCRLDHGHAGLTVDKVRAEQLFRASALQGNKPAMINLGLMYVNGDGGLPQDLAKAGEWFDRAHPASNFIK